MSKVPGNKIIDEILNGNEKVLTAVYKNVYEQMERFGLQLKIPLPDIKEAVQDAFETFYRQILTGKFELTCSLETYIFSIAKRVLLKNEQQWNTHYESVSSEKVLTIADEQVKNLKEKEIQEKKENILKKLYYSLDKESKQILSLTIEGYSVLEIKEQLQLESEAYVRKKRFTIKQYLIEKIKGTPDYEKLRNADPEDFELLVW
ncbi:MAG TPA: hypothetical protein DCQ26_06205 [Marinilabiliales bacterium]|jgi:RNA polymerase sigma factor (sigma-70 family)|nr:hypothetical protein [Salinivirgaceae bacterium]OFX42390.1 MAG: hypothetical protein A2W95_04145 [Bacteroidetes bacterium GWA2_40_14]OFX58486.1 MAG: hypothetical protein A2W84_08620 [Bacteroidetes bacterium GWC2_40_13]OFX74108.1 MAG: hypothetical protein A2W96_12430 [Bacteroidetes bacterium GWD2_40_43]OFX93058.1 MAG: hypothetical protein A2W97_05645 [Bacteroidetes bacterium GWE2_40_63]OFY21428.1 MAG: hypothetical protein A2W88_09645 [Bacteroidetes bacterium GWF2_40_13]OFZ27422.1 MAG: hypot